MSAAARSAPSAPEVAATHICRACSVRYVVIGDRGPACCAACGGELSPAPLPEGIYELRGPVDDGREPAEPADQEADLGYGESHGYGPGHGGPSGPGDAPALGAPAPPPRPRSRARRSRVR